MDRSYAFVRDVIGALALATALAGIVVTASPGQCRAQTPDHASDTSARRRIQPLPAIGSAPETGLQYGATMLAVWQPAPMRRTRPSSVLAYALRTGRGQTRIGIEMDRWSLGNSRRVAATLLWQEFPLPFYGVGAHSRSDEKATFTPKGVSASVTMQQRLGGRLYGTTSVGFSDQRIRIDSTDDARFAGLLGVNGSRSLEWTVGLLDDTRDHLYAPRHGHIVQVGYTRSFSAVASDFTYGRLRLDARSYHDLGRQHVLAAHLLVVNADGQTPFDRLALVGGSDILRGYALGRYRDQTLAAMQAEYRSPLSHRLGAVLFAGAGMTAPGLRSLTHQISQRAVLPTYGAGLRVQIDPAQGTSVRADYGRGRDGASGVYIGFNQAF